MTSPPLYQEIAETIRQAIFYGKLQPGDELPPVREMSAKWHCAPGTVQRAYRELVQQRLVTSRPGQGTRVAAAAVSEQPAPLRRAALVHEAESFLLGMLADGYAPDEVEQAVRQALDRWRSLSIEADTPPERKLRFAGSHDPAISILAARFEHIAPHHALDVTFTGSLGGLIALAEHRTEIAGSHLWDEETDSYNVPFVRRLLPGCRVALVTLAHRRLGLIMSPGNPAAIIGLRDLTRSGVRFINRQSGAGTRVWLDTQLRTCGIRSEQITGYEDAVATHSEVARTIAEDRADVGLGIEAAALAYGLAFTCLTTERYDLILPADVWALPSAQQLVEWLSGDEAHAILADLGGYDTRQMGHVEWVE